MNDTTEHSVTLRLPTTVEITIAPMAIVRWLKANGWKEFASSRDRIVIFRTADDRNGVSFPIDPMYGDIKRRIVEAISDLAEASDVEPHVMAARIIAADDARCGEESERRFASGMPDEEST